MTSAATIGPRPRETAFGLSLDEVRRERGWTIERLALHCRVSQTSMESWISDGFEPLLGYAYKTACALGYDVEVLADPARTGPFERRRPDAPGEWTFDFKGSVGSTQFGSTLRTAIAQSGQTLKGFAADIGLGRHAITAWVGRHSEPRLTSAMRAADELGLSLHRLCEGQIRRRA